MSNISYIEIDGTIYTIKDAIARNYRSEEYVTQWLENNVTQETGYVIDKSLSIEDAAADAKAVGKVNKRLMGIEKAGLVEITNYEVIDDAYIVYSTGAEANSTTGYKCTGYVDVTEFDYIYYTEPLMTSTNTSIGTAKYDENKTYMSGIQADLNGSGSSRYYADELRCIPVDCTYMRFTILGDSETYGEFKLYGASQLRKDLIDTEASQAGELTNYLLSGKYYATVAPNGVNVNQRTVWCNKNRFGAFGYKRAGSTFFSLPITSSNMRYISGTESSYANQLTDKDFKDIYIYEFNDLILYASYMHMNELPSETSNCGALVAATKNLTTGTIKTKLLCGNEVSSNSKRSLDVSISLIAELPEIYENQNIALIYQNRSPRITESWTVRIERRSLTYNTGVSTKGTISKAIANQEGRFIATKAYSPNDIILIGNNVYLVTANIAKGSNIINGTNVTFTNLGQLITNILNSQ